MSGDRRAFLALAAGLTAIPAGALADAAPEGELFVFLYKAGPAWKPGLPMQKQALKTHAEYMQVLMNAGKLFAGGRFLPLDGGMAIVVAADAAEARAILDKDPAVTTGVFVAEMQQWVPRFRSASALPPAKPA